MLLRRPEWPSGTPSEGSCSTLMPDKNGATQERKRDIPSAMVARAGHGVAPPVHDTPMVRTGLVDSSPGLERRLDITPELSCALQTTARPSSRQLRFALHHQALASVDASANSCKAAGVRLRRRSAAERRLWVRVTWAAAGVFSDGRMSNPARLAKAVASLIASAMTDECRADLDAATGRQGLALHQDQPSERRWRLEKRSLSEH